MKKHTNKTRITFLVLGLIVISILIAFFYIVNRQNTATVNRFNEQVNGLARTSTVYLADSYELYGNPPTIKFQNNVKDFLAENSEIARFKIIDTSGNIVFDSNNITGVASGNVGSNILNLSENEGIESIMKHNNIEVLISPYFEEWGSHQYSLLFYPSYTQVNQATWQFSLESAVITILLMISLTTIVFIFILNERYKVHREERKKLEQINAQRQEFMTLVAHNLRTPLTVAQGYMSLLMELKVPAGQRKMMDQIWEATKKLNELVENILLVTTILGKENVKIPKESISVPEIVGGVLADQKKAIDEKGIKISLDFSPTDLSVYANKRFISVIYGSLIKNAIKYNKPSGDVFISGKIEKDSVVFNVKDTGIGVAEEDKKGIFTQFHKSDTVKKGYTFNYQGSGLGLYTSKVLVEAMAGKIWFESEKDVGTTFHVSLSKE